MRGFDFSSWQSILYTLVGLALFTLISMGIRVLMMFTIQQRRERANRQINERLRTLIAAYKTLGGSFTGNLAVDPRHLRDLHRAADEEASEAEPKPAGPGSDRARRIRDSVEAALSDIILLGTEEQVRLAGKAVQELVAGRPIHVHELVVSLRNFIREALALDPVPPDVTLPAQGPTRPSGGASGRGRGEGGRSQGGRSEGGRGGGGGGGMGAGGGMGGGAVGMGGLAVGLGGGDTSAGDRS
ncbi:MAG: hypothetical protein KF849_14585 [Rhizobiaceae bacterium]|nr:hypothetical protein [Rhizobiaceae bacterium]